MAQFWPCHWNLLWVLCSFVFSLHRSWKQPQLVLSFLPPRWAKITHCWRGVTLYKSAAEAACRLVESFSIEGIHRGIPKPFIKMEEKAHRWGYFRSWDEHFHLCCLPMREHEKEPRRNECRGRWRAGTTALLHTQPEAAAGRTQTPAGLRDPSTIATAGSWCTGCENLRGRNKAD